MVPPTFVDIIASLVIDYTKIFDLIVTLCNLPAPQKIYNHNRYSLLISSLKLHIPELFRTPIALIGHYFPYIQCKKVSGALLAIVVQPNREFRFGVLGWEYPS